jgi:hypothetical protein
MGPLLEWLTTTSARAVEQAPRMEKLPASSFARSVGAYVRRCPLRALAFVALSGFFAGVVWGRI